ncbi:hypothetical protein GCM10009715_35090 [Paeniglutamicibacter psychrophenolicus]|uniref:Uncharacterized protein n=1 Tax=Paeniglutamicibacter psychrophenolicus TaxID=257454 RepID=A0ABS4WA75_9MICC|nr:hypothetical protein [Paeniglutamicibacter psychrophenolicus]MBP2373097.1 hypothetical protein [Paeniglutamicibacter psychrophenolicus]
MSRSRILVEAEIGVSGAASFDSLVRSLNNADLAIGHPSIEVADFSLLSAEGVVKIRLILSGDTYAQAESIATSFLQTVDEFINSWKYEGQPAHVRATDGSLLLMPA